VRSSTSVEQRIDDYARRFLATAPARGARARLTEFGVFGLKQGWACIFGAALLAVLMAARLWYPDTAVLARNDVLPLAAVVIQVLMVARLFDLKFAAYPRRWITAILAGTIYANFFTHHYIWDLRWVLLAAVVIVYGRCVMHFRVFRRQFRMPLAISFLLVALFIWIAENIATWSGAWLYPSQVAGWHPVGLEKLVAWFLLMLISVVLVAWVYKPQPPETDNGRRREVRSSAMPR